TAPPFTPAPNATTAVLNGTTFNSGWALLRSCPLRKKYTTYAVGIILMFWWLKSRLDLTPAQISKHYYPPTASTTYLGQGLFERIPLPGFCNNGIPGKISCDDLRHDGTIGVQQSFHLHDDLTQVAKAMESHPLVDYEGKNRSLPFEQLVNENWARLAGSSVWLPDFEVYLAVTRVIYVPGGVLHWPTISFIRGQMFDKDWNHMENYTISWNGEKVTFPVVFEIPVTWEKGDIFFGPEDPRIILEEGVEGAEPVIIFNMRFDPPEWPRAMWIHRPFSNFTTVLTIRNDDGNGVEKNWAPFFHTDPDLSANPNRLPNQQLHFVYSFKPLRILRCHLLNGYCSWVFEQKIPDQFALRHGDTHGDMRGGTNFMPVPMKTHPGIRVYVGFPRTHIDWGCEPNSTYRPELVIMSSVGSNFHIVYASDAIDFGHAVLDETALRNSCAEGHILIANSISRWDLSNGQDIMTLSLTVADKTVQITRLHGVGTFIQRLPYFADFLRHDVSQGGETLWNFRWSAVGNDVLACSVEAAGRSSLGSAIEAEVRRNETLGLLRDDVDKEEEKPSQQGHDSQETQEELQESS
ncbi:Beta-mannosyltransferase 1, partial [Cryomyces antarcticus]